jgi:rSAM/selenodomain-associated transferase 2
MSAPLTIIIPTFNASSQISPLLQSVFDGVVDGLVGKVVLADGGSDDAIARIADDTGAELVTSAKGRGTQLAAAANTATTPWLMFVHADSALPPDWVAIVRAHINTSSSPAAFRLSFNQNGLSARHTAGWANLRTRVFNLPYGDQGLLIRHEHYTRIGGYDPIPLMEDVAIARKMGTKITLLPATITTSADRYISQGWYRQGTRNLLRLLRFLGGSDPATLVSGYSKFDT